jgi:hypothetical protein
VQQLGNHAAHGITHGDKPSDTKSTRQRGDVVSAILKPEPRTDADPVAMAAQVGGDDTEIRRKGCENLPPIQLGREHHPVNKYEGLGAPRPSAFPYPRRPAAG